MNIFFNSKTGTVSQSAIAESQIINIQDNQYLKASILPIPGELVFYPQVRDSLDLNLVAPEKYYFCKDNNIEELDTSQISFPKECKYC